jgi:hypothetical protein
MDLEIFYSIFYTISPCHSLIVFDIYDLPCILQKQK